MNKAQLIKMIHIAKGQLGLDDETYRTMLAGLTGTQSCKDMDLTKLNTVYQHLVKSGFKPAFNQAKTKRLSPKTSANTLGEVAKIRAIWITMFQQGFIRDGSETALDTYISRMLNRSKVGFNVSFHAQFISWHQATKVLEMLKNWHKRAMVAYLTTHQIQVFGPAIDPATQKTAIEAISAASLKTNGYHNVCAIFELSLSQLKQQSQPSNNSQPIKGIQS